VTDIPGKLTALERVVGEVRLLFHHLRAAADQIHAGEDITTAHRGVLESLYRGGAETVPGLARSRPVARQHIQVLVNDLLERGLVKTQPNPAHKRSSLIALTAAGRRRFELIRRREQTALSRLALPLGERKLDKLAADLAAIRRTLAEQLLVPAVPD
jgi:DNA-binding MarR family transcriptional regulator